MDWLVAHWPSILSLSGATAVLTTAVGFGPRAVRRLALMLDCEMDRVRWEEANKLRDGEIALLRRQVVNLQADVDRLLTRSVESGAASAGAAAARSTAPIPRPTSAT